MKRLLLLILFPLSFVLSAAAQAPEPTPNELFKIAFAAQQMGNYELALKTYNKAIEVDPFRNHFYYNRGLCYKILKQYDLAIADFNKSLEMKITAEAYYQIGCVKYETSDLQGAKQMFETAKGIKEDFEKMNFYLGLIYFRENKYEESVAAFTTYTQSVRVNGEAYYYMALSQAKMGQYSTALANLKTAQMYKITDWKLFYKFYEIYLAMNDKQNALDNLTMVIEMGERKVDYYEERARLYYDLGNKLKYDEDMEHAQTMRSSSASAN
jgi:tetratricopeptide (TPR) repeat protein